MLSIIIPTLNEEKELPKLLESIKKQDFKDYEIIVADAGSQDRTVEIANRYGCLVVSGGMPSKARNSGAKRAKGDLLLFIDADVVLKSNSLKKLLDEFEKRKLKIASFYLKPKTRNIIIKLLFSFFYNSFIFLVEKILAHGAMAILIERELFERLKGFDEEITLSEDHDLARRAEKLGKFGILRTSKILVSDRRFKKDGLFKTCFRYFACELHTVFIGPVKSDIFKYRFNHYSQKKNDKVK